MAKKITTMLIQEETLEKLRKLAYIRNKSKAQIVREVLQDYLKAKADELNKI